MQVYRNGENRALSVICGTEQSLRQPNKFLAALNTSNSSSTCLCDAQEASSWEGYGEEEKNEEREEEEEEGGEGDGEAVTSGSIECQYRGIYLKWCIGD